MNTFDSRLRHPANGLSHIMLDLIAEIEVLQRPIGTCRLPRVYQD